MRLLIGRSRHRLAGAVPRLLSIVRQNLRQTFHVVLPADNK